MGSRLLHYRDQFLDILADGFIRRPCYMDTYMPHSSRVAIGQLRVSSHRLEIETGRAADIPREERICRVCRVEIEDEEHFVCRCSAYDGIRGRYGTLFTGQPTLREIMDSRDQRQLGRFLLEIQSHRDSLLQPTVAAHTGGRQSQFTEFFIPRRAAALPPSAHTPRGVTLQQAQAARARRRPRARGYRARDITDIRLQRSRLVTMAPWRRDDSR
ncbi:hypothetical protein KP509_02G030300 [Ceratopteris richardii]|uniref:Uncharacterized protein n=1 Tax=Ceratopteris richardii TaxID=49495 RepID=A0A8T2V4F8_CERRI|nr:hypothetical protein KP509_02G030300 [Ceratopteris richardii]